MTDTNMMVTPNTSMMVTSTISPSTTPTQINSSMTISMITDGTMTEELIIGASIGAAVAVIIIVTAVILCIIITMKKYSKAKAAMDLTSTGSEKSPNRDGYVNALYDGKSTYYYSASHQIISTSL